MVHRASPLLFLLAALHACSGDSTTPSSGSTSGSSSSSSSGSGGGGGSGSGSGGGGGGPMPSVELVGHSDLGARGMNAALAVAGDHVYVGSRIDGSVPNAGVQIVDVKDPKAPTVVGSIGAPDEALLGMSSRELRAIPDKNLLIVLNIACGVQLHGCKRDLAQFPTKGGVAETDNLKFYDISTPAAPKLVATHDFGSFPGNDTIKPHELFLWRDPKDPARILLFVSTPIGPPTLSILDISDLTKISLVTTWDAPINNPFRPDNYLHSLSVSDDGKVAYLAYLGSGFFMADTSAVAAGTPSPMIPLLTPDAARVDYSPPNP